jgi:ABC transporter substrate binding protein
LQQATGRTPIVFAQVTDPVGSGLVESLARPGGNTTGFTAFEYGVGAKWLELLKEIAPRVTRVAVLRDLTIGIGYLAAIQAVAPALGVELTPVGVRDAGEIERAVTAFARGSNDGMIVPPSTLALTHRELIAKLAVQHRLPAVYGFRYYVAIGGLVSYGPDTIDPFRRAAGYVDRILKGEKPADLPVQAPTKYELVINLKTARAIGGHGASLAAFRNRAEIVLAHVNRQSPKSAALALAQRPHSLDRCRHVLSLRSEHCARKRFVRPEQPEWRAPDRLASADFRPPASRTSKKSFSTATRSARRPSRSTSTASTCCRTSPAR